MKVHRKKRFEILWIVILSIILAVAIITIWDRQAQVRELEKQLAVVWADLKETSGDLADMQDTPLAYLMLYRRA